MVSGESETVPVAIAMLSAPQRGSDRIKCRMMIKPMLKFRCKMSGPDNIFTTINLLARNPFKG